MSQLKRLPNYESYQFALLAEAGAQCPNPESFLPAALRAQHEARLGMSYTRLREETKKTIREDIERRALEVGELRGEPTEAVVYEEYGLDNVSGLRYLIEGQAAERRLDLKDWSVSRAPAGFSYNFSTGFYGFGDFIQLQILSRVSQNIFDRPGPDRGLREIERAKSRGAR